MYVDQNSEKFAELFKDDDELIREISGNNESPTAIQATCECFAVNLTLHKKGKKPLFHEFFKVGTVPNIHISFQAARKCFSSVRRTDDPGGSPITHFPIENHK
jgi:hypothetical protein